MNRLPSLRTTLALFAPCLVSAQEAPVYKDPKAPLEARVDDLFARMTPEERLSMFSGTDFSTQPIPRLGVPIMDMADAGQGVRGGQARLGGPATYFGSGVIAASTWDRDLIRRFGQGIGEELRNKGSGGQVILGPAVNIHRSPLNGRNSEYFSEDPFLASEAAVAYIQGVQGTGVGACVKHFACNNEEVDRGWISVEVDERALREIYLPAFEASVKRGKVWTLMTSYNKVRGAHNSANWYLDTRILRGDWGYDGLVMSDWGGVHEIAGALNAGNDLEMPGVKHLSARNVAGALAGGLVTQATLDESLHRILRAIIRTGVLDPQPPRNPAVVGSPEHLKIAHDTAAEGMILLKNTNSVLPLDSNKVRSVAVFGRKAKGWQMGGGGSPEVRATRSVSPLDSVTRHAAGIQVSFAEDETTAVVQARARAADVALVFVGSHREEEGFDRSNMELDAGQADLIRNVAASNKNTVVIVSSGGPCKLSDWIGQVPAVIQVPFPGQEGGTAIAEILFGDINPSGKLTDTFAEKREDYPDYGNFPGTNGTVSYKEGIYVGYRWFDKKEIKPTFPFGFGLSYTTFKYDNLRISSPDWNAEGGLTATVDITNTGKREGAEVAQLYIHTDAPKIDRPVRELKGFDRVTLKPGETKTASFILDPRSFAYCDVPGKQWKADQGSYTIEAGPHSRYLPLKKTVRLTRDWTEVIPGIGANPPASLPQPLARGKRVVVSSTQDGTEFKAEKAVDDDLDTRWSSNSSDPQWIAIDLGAPTAIDGVQLNWETARAKAYEIQVSDDGKSWKAVFTTDNGSGSEDVIRLEPVTTRWVRMYGTRRTTNWGYSLFDFNISSPRK